MRASKEFIGIVSSAVAVIVAMCGIRYFVSSGNPECRIVSEATELLAQPGEDAVGTFVVHNDGQTDLQYNVTPTCQCTKLSPMSGVVTPGHSETVRVSIAPLKELNAIRPVTVEILTNDPHRASQRVDFTVAQSMPWSFAGGTVSFGVISEQKYRGQVRTLDLTANPNFPHPIPAPQLKVIGRPGHITGKVFAGGADHWRIEFGLQPDLPVGQYTTNFSIGTVEHPELAHLPVFLRITENIAIRPVMTMLGSTETEPVTVEIHGIECELPASVVSVYDLPGVQLRRKEQISPTRVRVTLDLGPEFRTSLPQKLRITAAGLGESELLCVSSRSHSTPNLHVAHPKPEGSQP